MGAEAPGGEERRRSLEELLLAGVGWAALTVEAADELADDLARRAGADPEKMRTAVHDAIDAWRRELERVDTRREQVSDRVLARLGLARREEVEELALTVAQLDHRLRLLERGSAG